MANVSLNYTFWNGTSVTDYCLVFIHLMDIGNSISLSKANSWRQTKTIGWTVIRIQIYFIKDRKKIKLRLCLIIKERAQNKRCTKKDHIQHKQVQENCSSAAPLASHPYGKRGYFWREGFRRLIILEKMSVVFVCIPLQRLPSISAVPNNIKKQVTTQKEGMIENRIMEKMGWKAHQEVIYSNPALKSGLSQLMM